MEWSGDRERRKRKRTGARGIEHGFLWAIIVLTVILPVQCILGTVLKQIKRGYNIYLFYFLIKYYYQHY
jgi:Flp pilus assembly pilin Flp